MPVITVSMLLKSCAMPPVSWPTASIFWAWINCSSASALLGDVPHEVVDDIAVAAAKRGERDLDREFVAVPVHRGRLEPHAGGAAATSRMNFFDPLPVRIA